MRRWNRLSNISWIGCACLLGAARLAADTLTEEAVYRGATAPVISSFELLAQDHPDDARFEYELGMTFYRFQAWNEAIAAYESVLFLQKNNLDASLFLAYAHLFRYLSKTDLVKSDHLLEEVLNENPQNTDAQNAIERLKKLTKNGPEPTPIKPVELSEEQLETLATFYTLLALNPNNAEYWYLLGRGFYEAHLWDFAIHSFARTSELQPKNQDAMVLEANALMARFANQEDLHTSEALFRLVLEKDPQYEDADKGLQRVLAAFKSIEEAIKPPPKPAEEVEPWVKEALEHAKELSKQGCHREAIVLYWQVVEAFPKNPEYWFFLGREYVRIGHRCEAMALFYKSLSIKPDYSDSLIDLAKQYLYFEEVLISLDLFSQATIVNPKDVAGWVGLARSQAYYHDDLSAQENFMTAIETDGKDIDVLEPYTSFLMSRNRFTEVVAMYDFLGEMRGDPRIYRNRLFYTRGYTNPTFFLSATSTKEKEKDLFSHNWVASILYNGAEAGFIYPLNDATRVTGKTSWLDVKQSNLVSRTTVYDVKFFRSNVGAERILSQNWSVVANLAVEWASNNNTHAQLPAKYNVKCEPSLIFRYTDDENLVVFGETTDSWIFKNFDKNYTSVFARETLLLSFQHDFGDYRLLGADAAWWWYQDPIYNQEQDLIGWVQTGMPFWEEFLRVRYSCEYRQFRRQTTGYYSFNYQLTHWLKFILTKEWLFGGRCELLYWHGWRTTRGRNPQQQITTTAAAALLPDETVEDQIDNVTLTLGYTFNSYFDISLLGNYWHDSYDYTVWSSKFTLNWRF